MLGDWSFQFDDDDDEDSDDDEEDGTPGSSKEGVYVPPKVTAVPYGKIIWVNIIVNNNRSGEEHTSYFPYVLNWFVLSFISFFSAFLRALSFPAPYCMIFKSN